MSPKLFFCLFTSLSLFSCRNTKDLVGVSKKDFVEEFKMLTFCRCMENSSNMKFLLANEDASCRFPDFMIRQFQIIDSLGKQEVLKIKQDSIARIGRVAEGMEGKIIIFNCMKLMKSKTVIKSAKSEYRAELKIAKQN